VIAINSLRASVAGFALSCASALALAGCGGADDLGPPEIRFGQDTCHACGMIIEDERYAAAIVRLTPHGGVEREVFDDVGEMLESAPDTAGAGTVRRYVRDSATRQWLDAGRATFIKAPGLQTPMGSGIAAYADRDAARGAIEALGGGEVVDRVSQSATRAPDPATVHVPPASPVSAGR